MDGTIAEERFFRTHRITSWDNCLCHYVCLNASNDGDDTSDGGGNHVSRPLLHSLTLAAEVVLRLAAAAVITALQR